MCKIINVYFIELRSAETFQILYETSRSPLVHLFEIESIKFGEKYELLKIYTKSSLTSI